MWIIEQTDVFLTQTDSWMERASGRVGGVGGLKGEEEAGLPLNHIDLIVSAP